VPILYTYKDFAQPVFYSGPKYNFIKETSLNTSQKDIRKMQEADVTSAFDFIQDLPTSPDGRSNSTETYDDSQ
jgi:hypothetical protein